MVNLTHRFKCIVTALGLLIFASTPVWAQDADLETLYQELLEADEIGHERIADRIVRAWERSGSPAMDLLLRRGNDALEDQEPGIAVEHFTAAIDHAPDFAEAYAGRAAAYYGIGEIGPAIDDLRQVLVLNPRNFEAMFGVGILLEELERPEDAQEVYEAILAIYPLHPPALQRMEQIALQLEGQAL